MLLHMAQKLEEKNARVSSCSKPVKHTVFRCLKLHSATTGRNFPLSHSIPVLLYSMFIPYLFHVYSIWNNMELHGGITWNKSGIKFGAQNLFKSLWNLLWHPKTGHLAQWNNPSFVWTLFLRHTLFHGINFIPWNKSGINME
jgi:hypothetical protein